LDERILSALQELGLTRSEARTYVALVARGCSAATDIARDAKIPHPRIYDIMESLEAKGLVKIQTGRRHKYVATKPEVAFERLLKRFRERAEFVANYLSKIYSTKIEIPSVWMLKGRNNIIDEISRICYQAENEILLAVPINLQRSLRKCLREAYKKGVVISLVIYPNERERKIDSRIAKYADVRVREPPGSVLALADFDDCLLCSNKTLIRQSSVDEGHAIVSGDIELLQILSYFFYHSLWYSAKPVTKPRIKEYPKNFVHIWKVIEEVETLKKKGYNVKALVKGKRVRDHSPIEFEGLITKIRNVDGRVFSLIVEKSDGSQLTVGGRGASIEDVEANVITLMPFKAQPANKSLSITYKR